MRHPEPEELFAPCEGHPVETIANLDALPIEECGEPLVLLRDAAPSASFARPGMRLREGAAERLERAATSLLTQGYRLRVIDAYRAPSRQAVSHRIARAIVRCAHPGWPPSLVRELANKYVATPDALAPPPHLTGAAVDVTLRLRDGGTVRMSPRRPSWQASLTDWPGLDDEARGNRRILRDAMEAAEFSNYEEEWWHWSYGDSGWALRSGGPCARYGRTK